MMYLIVALIVLIVAVIYLATLDGKYDVKRSKLMDADIQTVFDKLRDFPSWADWSPWLIHEREAELNFSEKPNEEGGFYTWSGKYVGAGKLIHTKFVAPQRIEQRLEFTRPFKSVCDVSFELATVGEQTEVTWTLQGRMPFLFRVMAKRTAQMIGKDYDFGLAQLAGQLNPESEHPRLNFVGEQQLPSVQVLCDAFVGGVTQLTKAMQQGFPALLAHVEQHNGTKSGVPLAIYHKVNLKKMWFVADIAVPVADALESGSYHLKTLTGGRYFKVAMQGNYEFLDMGWYAAMSHLKMHKLKVDRSRPSLEMYMNDPSTIESTNQIQTEIYIPLK